jgi:hypothetical protein
MNIILRLEHGYYQMNTIYGIPMHRVNRKRIHVLILLNQTMVQWVMGNAFLFCLSLGFLIEIILMNRIQVLCDYERIQPMDNYIIQEYVQEPYLIDGFKFGKILFYYDFIMF